MFGRALFIPCTRYVLGHSFLTSHLHTGKVPFLYHASWHKEAVRLLVAFGKFTPCKEVGGSADSAPVLVKGCHRNQIRNVNIVDKILGLFPEIQELGNSVRRQILDRCNTTHGKPLQVRVLPGKNGVHSGGSGLNSQCFNIMGAGHQVGFGWQFVGRVSPVRIAEGTELSAVNKCFKPLLDLLVVCRPADGRIADIISQLRCCRRICFGGRADNVYPVQRMKMIKMNQVVCLKLRTMKEVSNNSCVCRYLHANGVFNCPHRGQCMRQRSDAAGALNKMMCVLWIPSLKNQFDPPKHLSGTPGIYHFAPCHFHFDAKVAFNSGNRIYRYSFCHIISPPFFSKKAFNQISLRLFTFLDKRD